MPPRGALPMVEHARMNAEEVAAVGNEIEHTQAKIDAKQILKDHETQGMPLPEMVNQITAVEKAEKRKKALQSIRGGLRLGISMGTAITLGLNTLQEMGLKIPESELQNYKNELSRRFAEQNIDNTQLSASKTDEITLGTTAEQIISTVEDILDGGLSPTSEHTEPENPEAPLAEAA